MPQIFKKKNTYYFMYLKVYIKNNKRNKNKSCEFVKNVFLQ